MIRATFIHADGKGRTEAEGEADQSLLDVGQAAGMPLEGTCEGQMACSTCHVIVDADDFTKLPRASEAEEDMLDLATGACRTSRLACQLRMGEMPQGITVRIPAESRDMQGL
jgi:ferredoxin-2, mitochondrial